MKTIFTNALILMLVGASTAVAQLSGTYTIGGTTPDYTTINDAVSALTTQGVSGPVDFNIRDGIYNEQIEIGNITGTSEINRVTFQSESGDSTAVVINWDSDITGASNNFTIELINAWYIGFKHLTIESLGTQYNKVVHLIAHYIHFENCVLQMKPFFSCNGFSDESLIFAESGFGKLGGEVRNCVLRNACNGIFLARGIDWIIEDNEVQGFSDFSLNTSLCDSLIIRDNNFGSQTKSSFFDNEKVTISGNQFVDRLVFDGPSGDAAFPVQMYNNFFFGTLGLEMYYTEHMNIHHNSFHTTGACLYLSNMLTGMDFQNNIFYATGNGQIIVGTSPITLANSDYNVMYSAGPNFIDNNGTSIADLAAWQAYSGTDANSLSIDPGYVSATDLHVCNTALDGAGVSGLGVLVDIDGETRNATTPDIGADEFDFAVCSCTLSATASVSSDYNGEDISCVGAADGEATVAVSNETGTLIYDWSSGGTGAVETGLMAGTYSCNVTDDNCTITASVTLEDPPALVVTMDDFDPDVVCINHAPFTLPTGDPVGGVYSGLGVSGSTFDPNAAGAGTHTIYYQYSDANSCTDQDSAVVTVDFCVDIADMEQRIELEIYPNPASLGQSITAQFSEKLEEVRVEVLDMSGRVVYRRDHFNINQIQLQVDLAMGMYRLRLIAVDREFGQKLLIR